MCCWYDKLTHIYGVRLDLQSAVAFKQACLQIMIEYGSDEDFNGGIFVRELCKPIVQAIAKCEADKSLLSRVMPMINTLTAHASSRLCQQHSCLTL
jgi:hypothetical protein